VLSPMGERQARKLGEYWLANGVRFDEVYTGPLVRQVRTEQIVAECFREAGVEWPASEVLPGLKEYDAPGVLSLLVPAMAARDERFAGLVRDFEERASTPDRNRYFQRMFEVAMRVWLEGRLDLEGVEPWPAFQERVATALGRIRNGGGSNRRVAAFTSGGPIGRLVQFALGAPDQSFLDVNWRVRNCSLTEFVFSADRLSLDSFNGLPHLADQGLWTFR
jgi:broad specificity phosphatase PhoE